MKQLFTKTILLAVIVALAVASLPFVSVSAAGEKDPSTPPQVSNERLENIWARQLRAYERMGHTDEFIAKAQKLIERAKAILMRNRNMTEPEAYRWLQRKAMNENRKLAHVVAELVKKEESK